MDYHKKKLDNPFLSKRKKKKKNIPSIPLKTKLIALAVLPVLAGIAWFFLFCPVWHIDRLNVKGAERVSSAEIEKTARRTIEEKQNLIFFNVEETKKAINEKVRPKELKIEKEWPNTLVINIKEESYAYVWQEKENYYYAAKNGYILKKLNKEEYAERKEEHDLPLIINEKNGKVEDDRVHAKESDIDFILDLYNEFDKNHNNEDDLEPEKFILSSEANTVEVPLKQGPEVYFNASEDPKEQLINLLVVKDQKIKKDFKDTEYIDVRYEDKIYYQ